MPITHLIDGDLLVVRPEDPTDVFTVTGLNTLVTVFAAEPAARAGLRPPEIVA